MRGLLCSLVFIPCFVFGQKPITDSTDYFAIKDSEAAVRRLKLDCDSLRGLKSVALMATANRPGVSKILSEYGLATLVSKDALATGDYTTPRLKINCDVMPSEKKVYISIIVTEPGRVLRTGLTTSIAQSFDAEFVFDEADSTVEDQILYAVRRFGMVYRIANNPPKGP